MKSRILLFIIFILAMGCTSVEVCDDDYDSELVARFKTRHEGAPADTTVSALTLYGIREGLSDSLLYDSVSASGFLVALDPHHYFSSFVLQINGQADTLVISYDLETYMISYTCGFANLFTIDDNIEWSSDVIKSDTILNDMIDAEYEENEEHIWLYL
jgi:hypothetical protein